MSVIDILTRVDSICKKYDKYDIEKHRDQNVSGDDAFSRLYSTVDNDIETALEVGNDLFHCLFFLITSLPSCLLFLFFKKSVYDCLAICRRRSWQGRKRIGRQRWH